MNSELCCIFTLTIILPFRRVIDDFDQARQVFTDDEDITLVAEALQLSQNALFYDVNQLPGQLLGRIRKVS